MSFTAIVDYGSGNLHSAAKAFERAAREGEGGEIVVTGDPDRVRSADRVVLPGVGAFADCRAGLDAVPGMVDALNEAVGARARPFLGICVGAQLLATMGREKRDVPGLGWVPGTVRRIEPADPSLPVPHMGWNTLDVRTAHPLLERVGSGWHAYFVHSFHLEADDPAHVIATSDYAGAITAMVGRDNVVGTQFHPEKSQALGLRLIANFLCWAP